MLSFKLNSNKFTRSYAKYIGGSNSSGGGFLSSAQEANKSIVPKLNMLKPITNYTESPTDLIISHSMVQEDVISLTLDAKSMSQQPKPVTYICCLDVSGSMTYPSSDNSNNAETNKFSRWDLVKHSIVTIVHCLRPIDKISIITFSDDAVVQLELTNMNASGKKNALKVLESIRPDGCTCLWEGLDLSMNVIKQSVNNLDNNTYILLLTDGEPSSAPSRGILGEFIHKYTAPFVTVHTFGYGYNLDSKLLTGINNYAFGSFHYVPDYSMCITTFINFISNTMSNTVNKTEVELIENVGCDSIKVINHPFEQKCVKMGSIQVGQPRNLFLNIGVSKCNFSIKLRVKSDLGQQLYTIDNFGPTANLQTM